MMMKMKYWKETSRYINLFIYHSMSRCIIQVMNYYFVHNISITRVARKMIYFRSQVFSLSQPIKYWDRMGSIDLFNKWFLVSQPTYQLVFPWRRREKNIMSVSVYLEIRFDSTRRERRCKGKSGGGKFRWKKKVKKSVSQISLRIAKLNKRGKGISWLNIIQITGESSSRGSFVWHFFFFVFFVYRYKKNFLSTGTGKSLKWKERNWRCAMQKENMWQMQWWYSSLHQRNVPSTGMKSVTIEFVFMSIWTTYTHAFNLYAVTLIKTSVAIFFVPSSGEIHLFYPINLIFGRLFLYFSRTKRVEGEVRERNEKFLSPDVELIHKVMEKVNKKCEMNTLKLILRLIVTLMFFLLQFIQNVKMVQPEMNLSMI